jgi:hypothetical protein
LTPSGGSAEAACFTERARSRRGTVLFGRPKLPDEEMEERKEQLRVLLSATEKEIDKLVHQNPNVLQYRDIKESHGPKLKLLQERLGISKEAAGRLFLIKGKRALSASLATLENRMDWLQTRLNLNKSQLRTIVDRNFNVLTFSIDKNLEPTVDSIQSNFELSDKELTKLIVRAPDVLLHNMSAENIKQQISLLQKLLGLEDGDVDDIRKYIIQAPDLLYWPEERMKENQQWIQERFGLGGAKIAQMSRNQPQILYLNTTNLGDKVDSIQSDLSLSEKELRDLVSKFPVMLTFSPEKNLRPKLRYLQSRFELDDDALKNMVLRSRPLFSLSEDDIEDKVQFFSKLVGQREAREMVVATPYLLVNYSLKSRLKPRLEEVEKSGVKVRWNETLIKRLAIRTKRQWEKYKLGEAPRGRNAS